MHSEPYPPNHNAAAPAAAARYNEPPLTLTPAYTQREQQPSPWISQSILPCFASHFPFPSPYSIILRLSLDPHSNHNRTVSNLLEPASNHAERETPRLCSPDSCFSLSIHRRTLPSVANACLKWRTTNSTAMRKLLTSLHLQLPLDAGWI